jgi:hypothetical protein
MVSGTDSEIFSVDRDISIHSDGFSFHSDIIIHIFAPIKLFPHKKVSVFVVLNSVSTVSTKILSGYDR